LKNTVFFVIIVLKVEGINGRYGMEEKRIDINKIAVPKGGGAFQGLQGQMGVDLFTGCAQYEIPIYTSPSRQNTPHLALQYRSGLGNGVFGMGFSMGLPIVVRQTSMRIPKYDDSDVFVLEGTGELVLKERRTIGESEVIWVYRPRFADHFLEIQRIQRSNECFWEVTDSDNTRYYFGMEASQRVVDPEDSKRIFAWKLSACIDRLGNKSRYQYTKDGNLQCVEYGNYFAEDGSEKWMFGVEFSYTDQRIDPFSSFRSGFLIRTSVLCTEITMVHRHSPDNEIVHRMKLMYDTSNAVSLLTKVYREGLRRKKDGTVLRQSLPCLELSYTIPQWGAQDFYTIETSCNWFLSGRAAGVSFVDLYGEGMAGILFSGENACLYSRPLGGHQYAEPQLLKQFPLHRMMEDGKVSLMSLEGNGRYEMVVHNGSMHGFYPLQEDGTWGMFVPFESALNMRGGMYLEAVDLQGDRQPDVMEAHRHTLCYYPSRGKSGDGDPVICELPEDFPDTTQNSPFEWVAFADVVGDGLSHRVRVRNGSVTYWPNLGYGKFGNAVEMTGAPEFSDGFDAGRLMFADLDGTGLADLIYLYPDRVDIYPNRSGCGFGKPFSIMLPKPWSKEDSISFHDLTGTGCDSLIFCKCSADMECYGYDFATGQKPYLLSTINPNMGTVTKLTYGSSVDLYFRDRENGTDWRQKPPFPVSLVLKQEVIDQISDTTMTISYHYRNGFYDFSENRFVGFHCIEQEITQYNPNAGMEIEPIFVRNWYYTGMSSEAEYNHSDASAPVLELPAYESEEYRRALYGKCIRTETYGKDKQVPMDVRQMRYLVRNEGAFDSGEARDSLFTYQSEIIHGHYEGNSADPLITHKFLLELDAYGQVLHECKVHYPRRQLAGDLPDVLARKQCTMHVTETRRRFADAGSDVRLGGILAEEQRMSCYGLATADYFTPETLLDELEAAAHSMVPYGEEFQERMRQKKIVHFVRYFYWDSNGSGAAPLGHTGSQGLLHHVEEAVFPKLYPNGRDWLNEVFLEEVCGYIRKDDYWWKVRDVVTYGNEKLFYLPVRQESTCPFARTEITYDSFCLFPVELLQFVDEHTVNRIEALPDYTALKYFQIKDANDNVDQVVFDALGQVIAATRYGYTEGRLEGSGDVSGYVHREWDVEGVISDAKGYIQDMAYAYHYDLLAYEREQKPLCSVVVSRQGGEQEQISCGLRCFDGMGHTIRECFRCDDGKWLIKEQAVYDGRGNVLLSFPAYFADHPSEQTQMCQKPPVR